MSDGGVEHWAARFADEDARREGREPAWLRAARKEAFERFRARGFPTRRDEDWRYTNLSALEQTAYRAPSSEGPGDALQRSGALWLADMAPVRLVFVGGRFAPELSAGIEEAEGVRVESLARALPQGAASLESALARSVALDAHPFAALNSAFFEDGAVVEVDAGATPPPVALLFVAGGRPGAEATHPRIVLRAGPGSHATVIEAYASRDGGAHLTNALTEAELEAGASLDLVKLQIENDEGAHVSCVAARQARDTRFTAWTLSAGASVTRNDIVAELRGPGAECTLDGLYLPSGRQHVDNHTVIDHRAPHGTSQELYRGILAGRARGVFHGKIVVRPEAQQTNAQQKNENLLLADTARVDTKPELEIHADDVRCSHGSTIGHLEEEALFYLRSRGVEALAARTMLTRGFASAVTARLPLACLRDHVDRLLEDRLGRMDAAEASA